MMFEQLKAAWLPVLRDGIAEHVRRLGWSVPDLRAHQRAGLRALLAHAIERSPFHRRRLAGVDPGRFELADLASLPVMTKAQLMEHFEEVLTERDLSRAAVERALAETTTEPVPIGGRYIAMASGGSSGVRGVFVLDREAFVAFVGSLTRNLAARLPAGARVQSAMVCAASAVHATVAAPAFTVGAELPFEFTTIPVTRPRDEIVARLDTLRAPLLYGYPSMLSQLAGRLTYRPTMVTSTSETLTPELRAAIKDGLGCPIADTFGSTEGLVGATAPDEDVFTFNSDVCLLEIEDGRVLVTNLANRLQPLIRYELGDTFVPAGESPGGFVRAQVRGRADEVLQYPGGVAIHPHAIRAVLVKTPEVIDYQLRQTTRGVEIVAVVTGELDAHVLCRRAAAALVEAGLPDAEVSLTQTGTLPRDHRTGKLQRVVPIRC